MAEIIKRTSSYVDTAASIVIKSGERPPYTFTTVGTYTISQDANTAQPPSDSTPVPEDANLDAIQNDLANDTHAPSISEPESSFHSLAFEPKDPTAPPLPANFTASPNPNPNPDPAHWDFGYVATAQKFPSLDVFITIIRSLARLSEFNHRDRAQQWRYLDDDSNILAILTINPAYPSRARYEDVTWALDFMARWMLAKNKYQDIGGVFFDDVEGVREEYATLEVKRPRAPVPPVGGEEGMRGEVLIL